MNKCIECGTPTAGSIGAAGLRWKALCQPCKDKADEALRQSLAAQAAAYDSVMPKVMAALGGATVDQSRQPAPETTEAA